MFTNIGQDKHGNKQELYKKFVSTALVGLMMAVSAVPVPALADTSLTVTPLPTLLSKVQSLTSGITPSTSNDAPADTFSRMDGVAVSDSSPITVPGNWKQKKYIYNQTAS